eukprot:TRINITY_DN2033_c0_g1_i3.p1 TRINITY_DN2033_c0_g1~~TRINITY_DN2033_c0_g1_i3.p1  ORF type:complete len:167 (-),score=56.89 TRINITY_DN2033_c0_g1_i3:112-612(-)
MCIRDSINAEYGGFSSVAMVSQGALVLRLEDPDHFLNIPRAVATTESAYIRGAVNRNRRVVCGIGEINLDPESFGSRQYTDPVLQIPVLEKFFGFLQSKDNVSRVVSIRMELATLESAYQEGLRQISQDPSEDHIFRAVSYTHLRAHETPEHLVCRLLLEKKKKKR